MGLLLNDSAAFRGYTLFAPLNYNVTYLIDNEGRLIHSWQSDYRPGNSVYLLENGDLLRAACVNNPDFQVGGTGGLVERYDWDGNLIWSYEYSTDLHCQHHDLRMMPGGNILMVAWEYKTRQEAVDAGRNPEFIRDGELWPDHVIEVNPATDSIVWEWHLWDHLVQRFDSTKANYGVVRNHPELVNVNFFSDDGGRKDWTHSNAVSYNAGFDQVMISSRMFSEVWIVDHSTTTEEARGHTGGRYGKGGDLLYRWGNPATYNRGGTGTRRLYCQHDANWIADSLTGAGHILCFNNGTIGHAWSAVDEFIPPIDSLGRYSLLPDTTFGPDSACWSYGDPGQFYASAISGAQRLPGGNTLVCNGPAGEFFEVTSDGATVWRYVNPVTDTGPMIQYEPVPAGRNQVFRATRYSPGYPAFAGRSLVPGEPIERYPTGVKSDHRTQSRARLARLGTIAGRAGGLHVGFSLAGACRVAVTVRDPLGRSVLSIPPATFGAGEHGVNAPLAGLPAGAYFCSVRAGTDTRTIHFVLPR